MNFKVFLVIFDISIFIQKYSPYIRYIHKMQVPIYPSKPIFPTLVEDSGICLKKNYKVVVKDIDICFVVAYMTHSN